MRMAAASGPRLARRAGLGRRRRRDGRHADLHGRRRDGGLRAGRADPRSRWASKVVHCGEAGAGQAAKICNNMILGISMIGVGEAFVLAEKLGLSHQALFDVASTSSGQCWSLTTYCPVPGPVPATPGQQRLQAGLRGGADAEGPEALAGGGSRRRGRHHAARRARRRPLRSVHEGGLRGQGLLGDHRSAARAEADARPCAAAMAGLRPTACAASLLPRAPDALTIRKSTPTNLSSLIDRLEEEEEVDPAGRRRALAPADAAVARGDDGGDAVARGGHRRRRATGSDAARLRCGRGDRRDRLRRLQPEHLAGNRGRDREDRGHKERAHRPAGSRDGGSRRGGHGRRPARSARRRSSSSSRARVMRPRGGRCTRTQGKRERSTVAQAGPTPTPYPSPQGGGEHGFGLVSS